MSLAKILARGHQRLDEATTPVPFTKTAQENKKFLKQMDLVHTHLLQAYASLIHSDVGKGAEEFRKPGIMRIAKQLDKLRKDFIKV